LSSCNFLPWILWSGLGHKVRHEGFEIEITKWIDQGISVQKLIAATKLTKLTYEILINKKSTRPKSQEKWVRDCKLQAVEDLNWTLPIYFQGYFQFKFLHRRIAKSSFLFKIRISDTALNCYLCKADEKTLIHLFWEWSVTKSFWESVKDFFVSIHLIPASRVLDMYECLALEEGKMIYY